MSKDEECFSFERLRVWQKAVEFARAIYRMTRAFPKEELFGLTSQLRRASVSVAANIAEGASRSSSRDRARFCEVAYGSLCETATLLRIAAGEGLLEQETARQLRVEISGMLRMISGLKRATLDNEC